MSGPQARNRELETAAFSNPDDADAWCVYADWLESVGDPRGELVSLSLSLRPPPDRVDKPKVFLSERRAVEARIHARQQPLVEAWRAWAQTQGLGEVSPRFECGFVRELAGPLPLLLDHLDALFERDPIQRLILHEVDGAALLQLCEQAPRWTEGLRYLKLSGDLGPLGAAGLAELSLPRLERLNLLGAGLDDEACSHISRLDTRGLRALTLTANEIGDEGLALLLESPTRDQWRELYLSETVISRDGLEALANTTELGGLERLCLVGIDAEFASFEVLIDPPMLRGLTRLELSASGSWRARAVRDRLRERYGSGLVLC